MISYIERLLKEKTDNTHSEKLYVQWVYDKKLVSRVINSIPIYYPHYTLHDETHSNTIISNIVRILGCKTIEQMTAIDLWFLLESSYYHDVGMFITADSIKEEFPSIKFVEYFENIINNSASPLSEYSSCFEIKKDGIIVKERLFDVKLIDSIRLVIADYFRSTHAERSANVLSDPIEKLSLNTPRGLLPKRLYDLLSNICAMHTQDFNMVMTLPHTEVGLDYENAHPRYIACLLRLGDLLDLDSDRYSEVLFRSLGELPKDSLTHIGKHQSIRHFRLDTELIEVIAKCDNYDVAFTTQEWFNCLYNEYMNQTLKWNQIIPNKEYGVLPSLGDLQVDMEVYDFIDGKDKPSFTIDTKKALKLLSGTGLYDEPYKCIREILQNAVDATLVRLWLDYPDKIRNASSPSDFFRDERDLIEGASIEMKITHEESTTENDNEITWSISIKDSGIGISKNELTYLANAGTSDKNAEKNRLIKDMPEWLKPSGIFGIGFQSIFAITELVVMKSKSYFDEKLLELSMYGPDSKRKGAILLKKGKKTDHSIKPGTEVCFKLIVPKKPVIESLAMNDSNATKSVQFYDPIEDDSIDYDVSKIIDEVISFNQLSYIPINLSISNNVIISSKDMNIQRNLYYDNETGIELSLVLYPIHFSYFPYSSKTFYRNQEVKSNLYYEYLQINYNILKGKADDVLMVNREKFLSSYRQQLRRDTLQATFNYLYTHLEDELLKEYRTIGSMFIDYYWNIVNRKENNRDKFSSYWKEHPIEIENGGIIKIEEALCKESIIIEICKEQGHILCITNNENKLTISMCEEHLYKIPFLKFMLYKLRDYYDGIKQVEPSTTNIDREFIVSKNPEDEPITLELLLKNLKRNKELFIDNARDLIPCCKKYKHVRLKLTNYVSQIGYKALCPYVTIDYPVMLSPYAMIDKGNRYRGQLGKKISDKFCKWVYDNRYNEDTTMEMIKSTYDEFLKDTEPHVIKDNI